MSNIAQRLNVVKIGMDVHKETFTLCALGDFVTEMETKVLVPAYTVPAKASYVVKLVDKLKQKYASAGGIEVECGYEAGCLGYSLYKELTKAGIKCTILAPTTMFNSNNNRRVKNDSRDSMTIAQCLMNGTYSPVFVLDEHDEEVKEYIRMADDHRAQLKRFKQQLNAFLLRLNIVYGKTKWTKTHLEWLRKQDLGSELNNITRDEYLRTIVTLTETIARLDRKIIEIAQNDERYKDIVARIVAFRGIKERTALAIVSEVGDFNRFPSANKFAAFLGLTPGEHSSGAKNQKLGINKAGNGHLRRLLVESAQAATKGTLSGVKSYELIRRQTGLDADVIAYADKCNDRLRRRQISLTAKNKPNNVAKTAVARELACFVWGMATKHFGISQNAAASLEHFPY